MSLCICLTYKQSRHVLTRYDNDKEHQHRKAEEINESLYLYGYRTAEYQLNQLEYDASSVKCVSLWQRWLAWAAATNGPARRSRR